MTTLFRHAARNRRLIRMADVLKPVSAGRLTLAGTLRAAVAGLGFFAAGTVVAQTCSVPTVVASLAAPTNVRQMVYSPAHNRLVIRNSGSAIAAIDATTGQSTLKLSNTNFTDLAISPSGRYVFGADYGGENIGYGTPANPHYVHRLDLVDGTWDTRTVFIAGGVQAVSDDQFILKSKDQWVTFTNNRWGAGPAAVTLNDGPGYWGPGYYASVYSGDFRYDANTGRLLHGNSGSSSNEIQAFRLIADNFVKQEGSGTYGSAQDYGGSIALATDGSAFYDGRLQVDALDVSFNRRVFAEPIYAATGSVAFGNGRLFDAHSGDLLGSLGFATTVYALNPGGQDFWAFDPGQNMLRHFTLSDLPCGIPSAPVGVNATFNTTSKSLVVSWSGVAGATGYKVYLARQPGVTKSNYGSIGGLVRTTATSALTEPSPLYGAYYLVVTATNDNGESLESAETTINVPDYLAPTVPSGLVATPLDGARVQLTWAVSSDNVGVPYYRIYRDGLFVGNSNYGQASYVDTGLRGFTAYSYTISACDAAFNCSQPSAAAAATTTASTTPDPFSFNSQYDVPRNALIISNSVTLSGLDAPTTISIAGGMYSIDGAAFTSATGTVGNGQSIRVRVASGSSIWNNTSATLNVGGVISNFSVQTGPARLIGVKSRKIHGGTDRDIPIEHNLALGDTITTEPRMIGSGHRIVFQFDGQLAALGSPSAVDAFNNPVGNTAVAINPAANNEVIVTVTGVPDGRRVMVRLSSVDYYTNASAPIGFLVGDVNNSRSVNGSDIMGAKARAGSANAINFRADLNADGVVDAADVSAIKSRTGSMLP